MTIRYPFHILLVGLGLGWAFDLLFWGKIPGISVLIYAILLLTGLFLVLRWQQVRALAPNLWMPALIILFAAMVFLRANPLLIFLNIVAILVLLMLISNHLIRESVWRLHVFDFIIGPIKSLALTLLGTATLLGVSQRTQKEMIGDEHSGIVRGILVGLLITVPILLVLIPMLASADLIFNQLLHDFFAWDKMLEWGFRLLFMVIIGLLLGGAMVYTTQKQVGSIKVTDSSSDEASPPLRLGPIAATIPLVMVDILFLIFVTIQIPYLFGGELNIGEHSFTYAEYARRGFGELVFVAVFIFAILLLLQRFSHLPRRSARTIFNVAATLMLLLTMILLASAFKRLALYESVYGYTTMRIYPHVFMIWLAALLAWFVATLWVMPGRLAAGMLVAAFGFIITLNLLNPDAFIVRKNVARHQAHKVTIASEGDQFIDVYYLLNLSDDAVPELIKSLPELSGSKYRAEDELRRRYQRMQEDDSWRRWQSWNLSRWRAYQWLDTYFGDEVAENPS